MAQADPPDRFTLRGRRAAGLLLLLFVGVPLVYFLLDNFVATDSTEAEATRLTIGSQATGRALGVEVVTTSAGARGRPLLVFLHGRGESIGSYLDDDAFLDALGDLGRRAPVVAFPEGGESGYWHDRAEGDWAGYVVDEVIPTVTHVIGTDPERVAIGGISMGGFGAYSIALENPGRFCAVGGHSAALWLDGGESAAGAFDDAEDFERHDVIERVGAEPEPFAGIPVWNDVGDEDPFLDANLRLVEELRAAEAELTAHVWPGGHDRDYWDSHWDSYLRFYAGALQGCGRLGRLR